MNIKGINLIDMRIYFKNLINVLAFSATLLSIVLGLFLPSNVSIKQKLLYFIIFIISNILLALIISLPKRKVELKIGQKINLIVTFRDIFECDGNIVIPFNEYFDTKVDDDIISSNTLHGKFIKEVFGGNVDELDQKIEQALSDVNSNYNESRSVGKRRKYPIGTALKIEKGGKYYILFAFTKFDEHNKAYCSNIEYNNGLNALFDFLHKNSQGLPVNLPLIGSGPSGVNLSKQRLLEHLIRIIELNDYLTISGGINICLHNSLKSEINLNRIDYLAKWGEG
jgi:hypothetical protein